MTTKSIDTWGEEDLFRYASLHTKTATIFKDIPKQRLIINWPWGYLMNPMYGFINKQITIEEYFWTCSSEKTYILRLNELKHKYEADTDTIFLYIDHISSYGACMYPPFPLQHISHLTYSLSLSNNYIDIYQIPLKK